ncbi:MAG: hypothetical protein AAF957_27710 [Planctomycetota bacterium]
MSESFDDIQWHDASLKLLGIDRGQPGIRDEISMEIVDVNGTAYTLVFTDCYEAHLALSFGVTAEETVRDVRRSSQSDSLESMRIKWVRTDVDLSDVQQFEFETNSTASVIRILARACVITRTRATPQAHRDLP